MVIVLLGTNNNKKLAFLLKRAIKEFLLLKPLPLPRQFLAISSPEPQIRCTGCNRILSKSILQAADYASVHLADYRTRAQQGNGESRDRTVILVSVRHGERQFNYMPSALMIRSRIVRLHQ